MTLTIETEHQANRTAVLTIAGRLSAMSVEQLREAVHAAIDKESNRVLLELSGVDFIDSSGLGGVISGLKTARQAGGDLRLVAPGPQVLMILRLTNVDRILAVYQTVEAAAADAE